MAARVNEIARNAQKDLNDVISDEPSEDLEDSELSDWERQQAIAQRADEARGPDLMFVSVTGVSHHETPVELRERFAFGAEQLTPGAAPPAVRPRRWRHPLDLQPHGALSGSEISSGEREAVAARWHRRAASRRRRASASTITTAPTRCGTSIASPRASSRWSSASPRSSARCERRFPPRRLPGAATPCWRACSTPRCGSDAGRAARRRSARTGSRSARWR